MLLFIPITTFLQFEGDSLNLHFSEREVNYVCRLICLYRWTQFENDLTARRFEPVFVLVVVLWRSLKWRMRLWEDAAADPVVD